jgi:ABC-type lipoprotein release transport system permease subunit
MEGAAVAIAIALLGTLYPAWRSLRLPIAQTLHTS